MEDRAARWGTVILSDKAARRSHPSDRQDPDMTPLDAALAYIAKRLESDAGKAAQQEAGAHGLAKQRHRRRRRRRSISVIPTSTSAIVLGPASNGLADIDLDCPEARRCSALPAAGDARTVRAAVESRQPLALSQRPRQRSGDRQGRHQVRRPEPNRTRSWPSCSNCASAALARRADRVPAESIHRKRRADRLVERQGSRSAGRSPAPIC